MKTTIPFLILGTLLTANVFAQSAAETTKEINAQTTITRGQIDNLIQKINNRTVDSRFRASDYWAQNQDFKNSIDTAMKNFEDKLEKNILAKASYFMDQYNAIYTSKDFSPEQKQILLKQRLDNIVNQAALLTTEYRTALREVYALIPNYDLEVNRTVSEQSLQIWAGQRKSVKKNITVTLVTNKNVSAATSFSFEAKRENNNVYNKLTFNFGDGQVKTYSYDDYVDSGAENITYQQGYVTINFLKASDQVMPRIQVELFQKVVYPKIQGKCKSLICLGLRASDQASLVTLINSNLDRNIDLKLADGNRITIKGLHQDIIPILNQLSRVDYPVELPFDI